MQQPQEELRVLVMPVVRCDRGGVEIGLCMRRRQTYPFMILMLPLFGKLRSSNLVQEPVMHLTSLKQREQ
ncbi:hypothetical protein AAZX31_15G018600 [Glycine max]|nr:hypothetical protein GLYMA_15G019150v4 [Glycine max]KAG4380781.1 hypothetical protein GLYMA_15G019150v4 [Glycine max]KAH1145055.1 hypothetical protein GYH30_041069 [Glycine max]KAH1145056.1 hypothetical protein GYH30_041069 [Glycine max]